MILKTKLLWYQKAAFDKLSNFRIGALFIEQGGGKTRTALEFVRDRLDRGLIDQTLWLCPCNTKENLKEDIIRHCGEMPDNIIIVGLESIGGSDRIYLTVRELVQRRRTFLIVDESLMVKNFFAKRTKRIIDIASFCPFRMLLNGTPVSKTEADLFAQWYILDKRVLGYDSYYSFAANHLEYREIKDANGRKVRTNQISHVLDVDYLTAKIAPYTYQIKKSECVQLPPKRYFDRCFYMTMEQKQAYAETREEFLMNVDELRSDTIYKLFTALQHVASGRYVTSPAPARMRTKNMFDDIMDNPRIRCLDDLMDDIGGEKVIIFAKYQEEVNEISELLDRKGISHVEYTGRIKNRERQENRQAFRDDVQVLIANKQCGAYGLNLQFCHNLIFYDNDFDFATRAQAEDRVHRLGQDHEVHIYDIVANDTIDEFISKNLGKKSNMLEAMKRYIKKYKNMTADKIMESLPESEIKGKIRESKSKIA